MGLTAGNAAGYRGGAINTGIEDFLVLPAVPVVPLLPGPALRDGFSHVLGLRIVVPEALRRPSGQLLRQRQRSPLQTLRRLFRQLLRQRQSLVDLSFLDSSIFLVSDDSPSTRFSRCCAINTFIGCPDIHTYSHDVLFAPVNWLRKWRSCTFQHSVVTLGRQYDQFQPSCDVTTYTTDSPAVGSRCTDSRASGGKLKLRMCGASTRTQASGG